MLDQCHFRPPTRPGRPKTPPVRCTYHTENMINTKLYLIDTWYKVERTRRILRAESPSEEEGERLADTERGTPLNANRVIISLFITRNSFFER